METGRRLDRRGGYRSARPGLSGDADLAHRAALTVKKFCDDEVVPLLEKSYWSEIALISVSAGVGEEMLFRGVSCRRLPARRWAWPGA